MSAISVLLRVTVAIVIALVVIAIVSPIFYLVGLSLERSFWGLLLWIPYIAICFFLIRMLVRPTDAIIARMFSKES